jgi:hypothetical protein
LRASVAATGAVVLVVAIIVDGAPVYTVFARTAQEMDPEFTVGAYDDPTGYDVASAGCDETALGFCVDSGDDNSDDAFVVGGRRKTSGNRISIGGQDEPEASECALDVSGPVCSNPAALKVISSVLSEVEPESEPALIISVAKDATGCKSEECVLTTLAESVPPAEAKILADAIEADFRVSGPETSLKWLTNENIDGVLAQLTRKHPTLKHLGFHMIDFNKHEKPLETLDMMRDVVNAGFDQFCVVINTDKYGGAGIHWFCLFCDFRGAGTPASPWTIEYFNSSGSRAPTSVAEWRIKTRYNLEAAGKTAKIIDAAPIQHQRDTDSECGVYCLYYIYKRIHKESLATFRTRIPDAVMVAFRKKLFKDRSARTT